MNFKLKLFIITTFAACALILSPAGNMYATDENVSDEKTTVAIDNEKKEVLSKEEKKQKKLMEARQRKELLNKIESRISANNKTYIFIFNVIILSIIIFNLF